MDPRQPRVKDPAPNATHTADRLGKLGLLDELQLRRQGPKASTRGRLPSHQIARRSLAERPLPDLGFNRVECSSARQCLGGDRRSIRGADGPRPISSSPIPGPTDRGAAPIRPAASTFMGPTTTRPSGIESRRGLADAPPITGTAPHQSLNERHNCNFNATLDIPQKHISNKKHSKIWPYVRCDMHFCKARPKFILLD